MNKIKNEFNEIKLDNREKAILFNKILEKKNEKRVNIKNYIFIFSAVACSILLFLGYRAFSVDVSDSNNLSVSYQKEIIINTPKYLKANNIDLMQINNNDKISIDVKKIVNTSKYSSCSGNLVITNVNGTYEYTPSVVCKNSNGSNSNMKYYEGIYQGAYVVDDGIIVATRSDASSEEGYIISNNLSLTLYDAVGNKKASVKYDKHNSGSDKKIINVRHIQKFGNRYYIFVSFEAITSIDKDSYGSQSIMDSSMILVYNESLEFINSFEIMNCDVDIIGYDDNSVIYWDYDNIYQLDGNGEKLLFSFSNINEFKKLEEYSLNIDYNNGYFYGVVSFLNKRSKIFKLDNKGNVLDIKDFVVDSKINVSDIVAFDNYVYVQCNTERVVKYDSDINYLKDIDIDKFNKINSDTIFMIEKDSEGIYYTFSDDSRYLVVRSSLDDSVVSENVFEYEDMFLYDYYELGSNLFIDNKLIQVYCYYDKGLEEVDTDYICNKFIIMFYNGDGFDNNYNDIDEDLSSDEVICDENYIYKAKVTNKYGANIYDFDMKIIDTLSYGDDISVTGDMLFNYDDINSNKFSDVVDDYYLEISVCGDVRYIKYSDVKIDLSSIKRDKVEKSKYYVARDEYLYDGPGISFESKKEMIKKGTIIEVSENVNIWNATWLYVNDKGWLLVERHNSINYPYNNFKYGSVNQIYYVKGEWRLKNKVKLYKYAFDVETTITEVSGNVKYDYYCDMPGYVYLHINSNNYDGWIMVSSDEFYADR